MAKEFEMSTISNPGIILHRIRVKLYPNYLQNVGGSYIARTDNEKTLTVGDVCAALKTRGGFTGNYEDLMEYVRQYYDEVAYQLCDGYAVTNGYYTIHPNIGGSFNAVNEAHDHEKHPVTFRFGTRAKLRSLVKNIAVDVAGIADTAGYIDTFIDYEENSVNGIFVPGNQFAIHGNKIKVEGDDPEIGVYFVPVDNPALAVKVSRIAENSPSKITGLAPDTGNLYNRIEIRTRYSGVNNKLLKTPKTLTGSFVLESA